LFFIIISLLQPFLSYALVGSLITSRHSYGQSPFARARVGVRLFEGIIDNDNSDNNSDNPKEVPFFDDFADFSSPLGDATSPTSSNLTPSTALQDRIRSVQALQIQHDSKVQRNWNRGNWQVRGFSLDPEDADPDDSAPLQRKAISCLIADASEPDCVWVGRTDGSVLQVSLGDEYLTRFQSKLTAREQDSGSIKVHAALVRDDDVSMNDGAAIRPFAIQHQLESPHTTPVRAMCSTEQALFTAAEGTSDIQQWHVHEDSIVRGKVLSSVHQGTILCLKAIALSESEDPSILVSVAQDGTLALWDMPSGAILTRCQLQSNNPDTNGESLSITCADVHHLHVAVGTMEGAVYMYRIQDLMRDAPPDQSFVPIPNGRFVASEKAITAIHCGGIGTLGRGTQQPTSLLVTGDQDGIIKQWELMSRTISSSSSSDLEKRSSRIQYEQWPKLATQRMSKRVHLFSGHGDPVTCLVYPNADSTRLVSASQDGTIRAWSTSTGKELFRMDGFTPQLSSLCMCDEILVTDGMKQYVCLHDFTVELDAHKDGFDLEAEEDW
jgi:WD40 repeat protein